MCDFISACFRRDGAIAHIPENSHSGAIEKFGWRENDQMAELRGAFFVEAEWNCEGEYPGADRICRGTLNDAQRKEVDEFYGNAAKLFADPAAHGERMCLSAGYFAGSNFADVRFHVLVSEKCNKRLADKLAKTALYASGEAVRSLPQSLTDFRGGRIVIAANCKVTAPALTKAGDVRIEQGGSLTAPALTEVSGDVRIEQGGSLTAPALTKAGYVRIEQGGSLTAPALTKAGYVSIAQGGSLTAPALTKAGDVRIAQGGSLTAPALTKAGK